MPKWRFYQNSVFRRSKLDFVRNVCLTKMWKCSLRATWIDMTWNTLHMKNCPHDKNIMLSNMAGPVCRQLGSLYYDPVHIFTSTFIFICQQLHHSCYKLKINPASCSSYLAGEFEQTNLVPDVIQCYRQMNSKNTQDWLVDLSLASDISFQTSYLSVSYADINLQ